MPRHGVYVTAFILSSCIYFYNIVTMSLPTLPNEILHEILSYLKAGKEVAALRIGGNKLLAIVGLDYLVLEVTMVMTW